MTDRSIARRARNLAAYARQNGLGAAGRLVADHFFPAPPRIVEPPPAPEPEPEPIPEPIVAAPVLPPDVIDVDAIIAATPLAEHKLRADHYFAWMGDDSPILKKPFNNVAEAVETLQGVSLLLRYSDLFPGAQVIDFGAGSCWLSRDLALLGCDVTAVDISGKALELGKRFNDKHPFAAEMTIDYHPFDGENLDLPDQSFDNILCFSSFHHVAAEETLLRHFHRILRPGGIVGFYEPGPEHNLQPQSQAEMRQYGVIERGIDTDRIWKRAAEIGFADMRVARFMPEPSLLPLADFNGMLTGPTAVDFAPYYYNLRPFFLYKAGERGLDSRSGRGLMGRIEAEVRVQEDGSRKARVAITNTGTASWRPSAQEKGGVRLSSRLLDAENRVIEPHYKTWYVVDRDLKPGESVTAEIDIPAPPSREMRVSLGLVAQRVAHFEDGRLEVRFD